MDDLLKEIDDEKVRMKLRNILVNGAKLEQFKKRSKKGSHLD
jgi:hypothetical protein